MVDWFRASDYLQVGSGTRFFHEALILSYSFLSFVFFFLSVTLSLSRTYKGISEYIYNAVLYSKG